MAKTKKATLQDIANYADVSVGTIDRVIHNRGKVSLMKRKKIEEAIKHLNFNPNLLARTLALGKQFTICTLFPETTSAQDYWSLPQKGVDQFANSYSDFGIEIEAFEYSLFEEESFVDQFEAILSSDPDGVVLAPLFEKESRSIAELLDERKIPYVFIDANINGQKNLTYIGPDCVTSGYMAGKLIQTLLTPQDNILVLNMTKGEEKRVNIVEIEKGFRDFFNKDKHQERQIHTLTIPSSRESDIIRELTKFYISNSNIKGAFVTNSMASVVSKFHVAHDLDIKLVGFDLLDENVDELKRGHINYLISQSPVFQGRRAIQTLFEFFVYKKKPASVQYVPLDIIMMENVDYYIHANS